jgi:hypothetical protein
VSAQDISVHNVDAAVGRQLITFVVLLILGMPACRKN